jgi:hypothetical protein
LYASRFCEVNPLREIFARSANQAEPKHFGECGQQSKRKFGRRYWTLKES